jgi:hypothetical protein
MLTHIQQSKTWYATRIAMTIITFSLFNSSFHTNAQQTTNNPGFALGFFSIDSNDARACSTANSTIKIEGETLEPGSNKPHKVKLEVTFKNGVVSAKDKDGLLGSVASNQTYGNFYFLTPRLTGHLTVTLKLKKSKSADGKDNQADENDDSTGMDSSNRKKDVYLVDLNLDEFKPIPDEPLPNQEPSTDTIPEYVDFAIPCD